ncbi:MAG: Panacea domain-containing protein [Bacteroidota bacterium]
MTSFKFKKAVQALNYFAKKEGGNINYMKAGKLVYLADRLHLRRFGRTITNDSYVAMKNGPVPSKTKDIILKSAWFEPEILDYVNDFISDSENYIFKSLNDVDVDVFSKTDIKTMDEIYDFYGNKNQFELSEYSHYFPEWKRFENELKMGVGKAFQINQNDFFENGITDKPFAQSEELLLLSKQHYQHIL